MSFTILAFAWRTPRFRGDESGVPLPRWLAAAVSSRVTRGLIVTAGLAFTAWITFAAFAGQNLLINAVFGTV